MQYKALRRFAHPLLLALLAVVCYVLFFYRIGAIGFLGPDEPRYADIAREMYRSGDFITPRLNGIPWFEKPPLMYWGGAIADSIFGESEFSARLPSALAATLCVFMIYLGCRKLWSQSVGIFAALLTASSVGFFSFAHAASMDMPLTVCLTLALLAFLMGSEADEPQRRRWFYTFYALLGLGSLAKGPIAFLLPAISLLVFLALRRRLQEWRTWHPEGAWIALAVAAPWYIACTWKNGYEFIQVFVINQNFQRFTSNIHGHERPLYYYIPVFLMLTFPWTFQMIPALRRRFDQRYQVLVWWAVIPLIFFSLSGSKLPGYILPSVPPFAILCAAEFTRPTSRPFKVSVFIEAGAMVFIGIALGFFGTMLNVDPHVDGRVIASVTFVLAALLVVIALWLRPIYLAGFNLLAAMLMVIATNNMVAPRFDRTDTMRPWAAALPQIVPDDQTVLLYKPEPWMEFGLQYYRQSHAKALQAPQDLVTTVKGGQPVLCIAGAEALDEIGKMTEVEVKVVQTIGNQTAFWAWPGK